MRFSQLLIIHTSLHFNCPSLSPGKKGRKSLWASQLTAGRGCVPERAELTETKGWLCSHLTYQATREHLSSLTQNPCHNPGLKLPLNLSWPSCPCCCSMACTTLCCCWDQHFMFHWLWGILFTYLEKRHEGKHLKDLCSKIFLCSQYWNIFFFLIETLSIKML